MVDRFGQLLAEAGEQIVARHAALRYQMTDLIGAQRAGEIARRDLLVRAGAHPGIGGIALAALLELLEQVTEPATDHASRGTAGQQAAQSALENVAKASAHSTAAG